MLSLFLHVYPPLILTEHADTTKSNSLNTNFICGLISFSGSMLKNRPWSCIANIFLIVEKFNDVIRLLIDMLNESIVYNLILGNLEKQILNFLIARK